MFHISNVDDAKSEWNINETHIIIPMIDGDVINKESDKILANSLTLNSLETGDQAMLSNALEHSFVIGLDKNLFETPNYKSDLVIIQNSDLKLLSCNNDLKNPVAYALSYVDQDRNEILWQSSVPKDGIYQNDKQILEVRDDIDYQDSELEKNEQINLVNIDSDIASQVPKTNEEILHEEINENKNEKSQFINYLTVGQNNETVPNLEYLDSLKLSKDRSVDKDYLKKVKSKLEKNLYNDTESVTGCTESSILVKYLKQKTEEKEIIASNNSKNNKNVNLEMGETFKGVSDSLPEKSLPLKKKAKMKRTLMLCSSENQRSLLKQDVVANNYRMNMKSLTGRKTKLSNADKEEQNQSRINTPIIRKVTKERKTTRLKNSSKKSKKIIPNFTVNEDTSQKCHEEDTPIIGFDKNKFCSIYDLVEYLKKCKMINESIWQTLNTGLKEMNVDILKEMNAKKNKKHTPGSINYSPQLKAFALVLYFKQPAAFNYLSQMYDTGWPSLKIIKDWKQRINSYHRQTFIGVEKDAELSS